jgi:LRR receptor-like serine/threonine-protein kinase FLS2
MFLMWIPQGKKLPIAARYGCLPIACFDSNVSGDITYERGFIPFIPYLCAIQSRCILKAIYRLTTPFHGLLLLTITMLHFTGYCEFMPSGICLPFGWNVPEGSKCAFSVLPGCYEMSSDCRVIHDWQPDLLEEMNCCDNSHIECRLDRIISLNLSSIGIADIPYSLYVLSELEILDLSNTGIRGTMPSVLTILFSLQVLNLGSNYLSGSISLDIGGLINIRVLNLEGNILSGQIPESLQSLVLLEELYLSSNAGLTGTIKYLPSLRIVDVGAGINVEKSSEHLNASIPKADQSENEESSQVMIVALSLGAVLIALVAFAVLFIRRYKKKNSDNVYELQTLKREQEKIHNKNIVLICKLSSGGFGTVWKAKFNGKEVAIKRMNGKSDDLVEKNKLGKMFFEEVIMIQQMKHDRIVKYISFEVESFSLIIELMPLGSLQSYIKKNKADGMDWVDRHQLMLDICEGMAYLHSSIHPDGSLKAELFHQDLKSGNVLLEKVKGELRGKIADFGLSRKCPNKL